MSETGTTCESPFGCDPARPPKMSSPGYAPEWVPGYGWAMRETTTWEDHLFQEFLQWIGPLGIDLDDNGQTPVRGMPWNEFVVRVKNYLTAHYGRRYVVVSQGHHVLIRPEEPTEGGL
jgi:hypothetical protein